MSHKYLRKCPEYLENPNQLVFSMEVNEECRTFFVFNSYKDFEKFYMKLDSKERHFYEVILGRHRMYLDVDVDLKKYSKINKHTNQMKKVNEMNEVNEVNEMNEVIQTNVINHFDEKLLLDNIVESILKFFQDLDINKELFVYSSHGKDKKSFHLIIHKTVDNYEISKAIAKLIKQELKDEYKDFLDVNVYKPKQQLRVLYSTKYTSPDRMKIFEGTWKFKDQWICNPIDKKDELKYSLVNILLDSENITSKIKQLLSDTKYQTQLQNQNNIKKNLNKTFSQKKAETELMEKAYEIVQEDLEYFFQNELNEGKLIISELKDHIGDNYMLILKNKKGYFCPIHKRIHDHENPFIYFDMHSSYFCCRRDQPNEEYHAFCMRSNDQIVGKPVKRKKTETRILLERILQ